MKNIDAKRKKNSIYLPVVVGSFGEDQKEYQSVKYFPDDVCRVGLGISLETFQIVSQFREGSSVLDRKLRRKCYERKSITLYNC